MMDEVIQVQDAFYILSSSSRVDDRTHVLKQGDTFAVFDRFGDFEQLGRPEVGLYHQDTRFLSRLALRLGATRPLLLSSSVSRDNTLLTVDLSNTDVEHEGQVLVPRGTVHVYRSTLLWKGTLYHRLRIHNYDRDPVELSLRIDFDADFADLFEVRGLQRERRGHRRDPLWTDGRLVFSYEGLDERIRMTTIAFDPAPSQQDDGNVLYHLRLDAGQDQAFAVAVQCEVEATQGGSPLGAARAASAAPIVSYERAVDLARESWHEARGAEPSVMTSNRQFNAWIQRSIADLHLMNTDTEFGPYPYAGVPWFSTAFGRDGIISALECLWFNPGIARGVLAYLSATQADEEDGERDAQPGKILHETRGGEMSFLGEVPFSRYYGSIDSTPLFLMLAGAYAERTGDLRFIDSIWPNILGALSWLDMYGDIDGDGFIEYARRSPRGLANQGWKDSHDAIFHANGSLADGPIALCEVQGYVYAARQAVSSLARRLGDIGMADRLAHDARDLARRFDASFWNDELGTYALALDGDKRQCAIPASNAGHLLYSGLVPPDRARSVADVLLNADAFSGWGVRTVSSGTPRYNPMSYHNGSIWPHDNALIAAGLSRYGFKGEASVIFGGLYDASLQFDLHRLPELFCGFRRRPGEQPTQYPVSCSPQTWASAAVLLLVESVLGLTVRGSDHEVILANPTLPEFLPDMSITGLQVGEGVVDLVLTRHPTDVGVNVASREGPVKVVVVK
jgi:glycogen debranching enzyme